MDFFYENLFVICGAPILIFLELNARLNQHSSSHCTDATEFIPYTLAAAALGVLFPVVKFPLDPLGMLSLPNYQIDTLKIRIVALLALGVNLGWWWFLLQSALDSSFQVPHPSLIGFCLYLLALILTLCEWSANQ